MVFPRRDIETETQSRSTGYRVIAPGRVPLVQPGDDLAGIILAALADASETLADGDVLVLAQKIVSKSEDRYRILDQVTPSARAFELAAEVDKDPRLVELILSEATGVAGSRKGVLVVDDGELMGIFTPKDLLSRVVAHGKSPDLTAISSVMTPNPDCVDPSLTLLDALVRSLSIVLTLRLT